MKLLQFAQKVRRDSGSFRDPGGFILHHGARVFRVILPAAVPLWRRFVTSGLPDELESAGLLAPTSERPHAAEILEGEVPPGSVVVEHERIPFVSYPYEWTFEMLRAPPHFCSSKSWNGVYAAAGSSRTPPLITFSSWRNPAGFYRPALVLSVVRRRALGGLQPVLPHDAVPAHARGLQAHSFSTLVA